MDTDVTYTLVLSINTNEIVLHDFKKLTANCMSFSATDYN